MRHRDRCPGVIQAVASRVAVRWMLGVLVVVLAAGCEEDGGSSSNASSAGSADHPVVEAWKAAGIDVADFDTMAGAGIAGGTCRAGKVAEMDTVLCRYPDAAAAKAARPAGNTYIGETTGVALPRGPDLLVIADRNKADPSGKTINKIAKTFLGVGSQAEAEKGAETGTEAEKGAETGTEAEKDAEKGAESGK